MHKHHVGRTIRLPFSRFSLLLVVLALVGAGLVLWSERNHGVGLDWDSVNYLFTARNLRAGQGFAEWDDEPLVRFAPLYPALLAIVSFPPFDPRAVAGPLSAGIFGLVVVVFGQYLRRRLASPFLVLWGVLAALLSPALFQTASQVLSEALFILLTLLALVSTDSYLRERQDAALRQAALFSALACLAHYMGVFLVAGLLFALLLQRGAALATKLRRMALVAFIALGPVCLWLLRNLLLTGTLAGDKRQIAYSLPQVARGLLAPPGDWVFAGLPPDISVTSRAVAGGLLLLALAAALGHLFIQRRRQPKMWDEWRLCFLFGGFALLYIAMLAGTVLALPGVHHGVQARYLTPVFLPLLFTLLVMLDRFFSRERRRATIVLQAGLCLWLALAGIAWARHTNYVATFGTGHLSQLPWAHSETLAWLRQHPDDALVLSNEPFLPHLYAGTEYFCYLPSRHPAEAASADAEVWLDRLVEALANMSAAARVVWFHDYRGNHLFDYSADDLRNLPILEPVAELADGVIFRTRATGALSGYSDPRFAAILPGPAAQGAPWPSSSASTANTPAPRPPSSWMDCRLPQSPRSG